MNNLTNNFPLVPGKKELTLQEIHDLTGEMLKAGADPSYQPSILAGNQNGMKTWIHFSSVGICEKTGGGLEVVVMPSWNDWAKNV